MVLTAGIAGAAAGGHALFGYNRANFLYDREMRQRTEFKILEFRKAQAEMWREDIRDITGLTERKMDNYLIVNTLLLGMCLGLFAEGRLDTHTPPWLLHFYMLTLGGAFMFLLMSVWLAMHASIIAQCSSVRILTQFVRLPVPTWDELEETRTYGTSFEAMSLDQMFRIPFTRARPPVGTADAETPHTGGGMGRRRSDSLRHVRSEGALPTDTPDHVDPWELEQHGQHRDLYELEAMPASLRRHIGLARRAAMQYQCFDAFARVAMTFGTNQLLHAISYYCLGYIAHHSGSPSPAWCAVAIMLTMAMSLIQLDFSLTKAEKTSAGILLFGGPAATAAAILIWAFDKDRMEVQTLVCVAYLLHGGWLLYAMNMCGIELQANGSVLPMKFRAVLYLDVFGWLHKHHSQGRRAAPVSPFGRLPSCNDEGDPFLDQCAQSEFARQYSHQELNEMELSPSRRTGGRRKTLKRKLSASGEMMHAPENAFSASSYAPVSSFGNSHERDTESDVDQPGRAPARIFQVANVFLINLWIFGSAMPFGSLWHYMKRPLLTAHHLEHHAFLGPGPSPCPPAARAPVRAVPEQPAAGLGAVGKGVEGGWCGRASNVGAVGLLGLLLTTAGQTARRSGARRSVAGRAHAGTAGRPRR